MTDVRGLLGQARFFGVQGVSLLRFKLPGSMVATAERAQPPPIL